MAKKSTNNIAKARALVEPRPYSLYDATALLQKAKYAKFDETVDLTMRLGVDTRHADQMVRGTVVLPHGLGKTKIVAVIASGDKIKDAQAAGAEFFGGEELVENASTVITMIVRAKPSAAKGKYIKSITLSSTMGPGVPLDSAVADAAGKH